MLFWDRLRVIIKLPYMAICMLAGCSAPGGMFGINPPTSVGSSINSITESASDPMGMLSFIGGFAIAGGIIALVITRGSMGIRACALGLLCILINFAVVRYADWVFIPVLVGTALISLAYAYRIVRQAVLKKKENSNG